MPIYANAYPNASGLVINEQLGVHSYEESYSTDTGAVQIWGGMGVGGNIFASNIFVTGSISSLGNLTANITATTGDFKYLTVTNSTFSANSVMNKGYTDGMAIVFGL